MNESLEEVDKNTGVKNSRPNCWTGQSGVAHARKRALLFTKGRRSSFLQQEVILEGVVVGNVESRRKALHICAGRQFQVETYEVEDPWPSSWSSFLWMMRPPSDSLQAETDTSCTLKFTPLCPALVTGSHTQRSKTSHKSGNNPS